MGVIHAVHYSGRNGGMMTAFITNRKKKKKLFLKAPRIGQLI